LCHTVQLGQALIAGQEWEGEIASALLRLVLEGVSRRRTRIRNLVLGRANMLIAGIETLVWTCLPWDRRFDFVQRLGAAVRLRALPRLSLHDLAPRHDREQAEVQVDETGCADDFLLPQRLIT
jgi:hypothetical protein